MCVPLIGFLASFNCVLSEFLSGLGSCLNSARQNYKGSCLRDFCSVTSLALHLKMHEHIKHPNIAVKSSSINQYCLCFDSLLELSLNWSRPLFLIGSDYELVSSQAWSFCFEYCPCQFCFCWYCASSCLLLTKLAAMQYETKEAQIFHFKAVEIGSTWLTWFELELSDAEDFELLLYDHYYLLAFAGSSRWCFYFCWCTGVPNCFCSAVLWQRQESSSLMTILDVAGSKITVDFSRFRVFVVIAICATFIQDWVWPHLVSCTATLILLGQNIRQPKKVMYPFEHLVMRV